MMATVSLKPLGKRESGSTGPFLAVVPDVEAREEGRVP